MNYEQKHVIARKRIIADQDAARAGVAQHIRNTIVGREVAVQELGRCVVMAVDEAERVAAVRDAAGQLYEVPFRLVSLWPDPPADKPLSWAERLHGIDGL